MVRKMNLHEFSDEDFIEETSLACDLIAEKQSDFLESEKAKEILKGYIFLKEKLIENIDNNKFFNILSLEYKAQRLDDVIFGKDQKRAGFRATLIDIKNELVKSSDINYAKELLITTNDEKTLPRNIPDNMPVFRHLNQLKTEATRNVSRVKSNDYKEFFRTRHDALQSVHVEIKNKYRLALGMKPQKHVPRHQKKENELER